MPETLAAVSRMINSLHSNEISFCHWKSNVQILESLAGDTDLDVLVLPAHADRFREVLRQSGFVAATSPRGRRYSGIEDWMGFDDISGKLIHVHLHERLVLGEPNLKQFHLPVEDWLLADCSSVDGMPVPAKEKEFILLIIRTLLKTEWTQQCKYSVAYLRGRALSVVGRALGEELQVLSSTVDKESVRSALAACPSMVRPEIIFNFANGVENKDLRLGQLRRLRRRLMRDLRPYERFPHLVCQLRRAYGPIVNSRVSQRFRRVRKKRLSDAKIHVALVGADGSGKTSLCRDLTTWLGWKLEVRHLYFGIPKGATLLRAVRRIASGLRRIGRSRPNSIERVVVAPVGKLGDVIDAAYWTILAWHRLRLARRGRRLAAKGVVVVAERFPLAEFWEMQVPMDGPRVSPRGSIVRAVSRLERYFYTHIQQPNTLIVLRVALATLRRRRSRLPSDLHDAKAQAVNGVPAGVGRVIVDANRSYEEVLLEVKRNIWRRSSAIAPDQMLESS